MTSIFYKQSPEKNDSQEVLVEMHSCKSCSLDRTFRQTNGIGSLKATSHNPLCQQCMGQFRIKSKIFI